MFIYSLKTPASVELTIMEFFDKVRMRFHNQLKAIQEFSKNYHFNGTDISASFVLGSAGFFPVITILDLNDVECTVAASCLCNISVKYHMLFKNYHYIPLNYTLASQHPDLLHYILGYYLFCLGK